MNHLCSTLIDNGTLVTLVCGDESTGNTTIVLIHLFKMALTKVIFKLFLHFLGYVCFNLGWLPFLRCYNFILYL